MEISVINVEESDVKFIGDIVKLETIFSRCLSLTLSKRHDYTSQPEIDNHENFKRSAIIAEWFKSSDDKPYAILIGAKLARLASLLDSKEPKHESIDDTFLDLINYCALWMERRTDKSKIEDLNKTLKDPCICPPLANLMNCPVHGVKINDPKPDSKNQSKG